MTVLRCRHLLPNPETAGYCDRIDPDTGEVIKAWDALREAARRSPDLRPCPRHKGSRGTWNWIYRKDCAGCPDAVKKETA
ncbi:hypothetical protein [Desulfovibrio sp. ZJ369]|uniref:hypothetical protein n=1 Tax=Desulfovibrio sp. ZJ369 TaxID=2709793 RepID=UPI0013EC2F1E|nr:hypothetical protein [Desulfovibrio sp. ZJ369]